MIRQMVGLELVKSGTNCYHSIHQRTSVVTMPSATPKSPIRYRQSSEYFSQQQWQVKFHVLVLCMKLCVQEKPAALLQPGFDALRPTEQFVSFCTTYCYHQHRPEVDVFHSISICPGLLGLF